VLPADIWDLLVALHVASDIITKVEDIYNNVGCVQQEFELLKCSFNKGTARALACLMWG